ncbi:hypothetical protein PRUPE_1G240100 [Prunus persica]|uniref:Uncharacterized protein n=1 Tax=Prunus persica TaxID=3760 RepID=A0A251R2G6_PRUPE|nr:hypothetical protein PRUPE_1G240100 [Prunus persica]
MARQIVVVALVLMATVGLAFGADAPSPSAGAAATTTPKPGLPTALPLLLPVAVLLAMVSPRALLVDLSPSQLLAPLMVAMPRVLRLALPPPNSSPLEQLLPLAWPPPCSSKLKQLGVCTYA